MLNLNSTIAMTIIDIAILIAVVIVGMATVKRGLFQLPSYSKKAVVLIFVGLAVLATLSVVDLVIAYFLPAQLLEAEAVHALSHSITELYWIIIFLACVFISAGILLITRVIGGYETTLAQSEARYRKIVEDQNELIVRWDREGIRTWMNDAYCEFFQQPREDLLGTSFFPELSEAVRRDYIARFKSLTPENPSITAENATILPDGTETWQEWTNRCIYNDEGTWTECQSVGRDITARKKAEIALKDSENRYRSLVENTSDWVWQTDLDLNHTYTNNRVEEILGYTTEELAAISPGDLVIPVDAASEQTRLSRLIAEQQGWRHWQVRMRHKDGTYRYLDSSATPIFDQSGTIVGFSGIDRDITFQTLLADSTIKLLAANLSNSQLVEALREFAEYFQVDRIELWWRDDSEELIERTHFWAKAGIGEALPSSRYKLSDIPWTQSQIANNEIVQVPDTEALPAQAIGERAISKSTGSKAFAVIPLKISVGNGGAQRLGVGRVTMYESIRNWTEQEIHELQLAFNVIATAEARVRIGSELQGRNKFHALVADVSTELLKSSVDESALTEALGRFALHFDLDALSCWWFDQDRAAARRSCGWFKDGVKAGASVFKLGNLKHYEALVVAGEAVRIPDTTAPHLESSVESALYDSLGITAALFVPLRLTTDLDTVGSGVAVKYGQPKDWSDQEVEDLKLAFNVIAIAEAQMRSERELKGRERFQTFLAEISKKFLGAHQDDVGDVILECLQRIAEHYALDRAGIWYFEDNHRRIRSLHLWPVRDNEVLPAGDTFSLDLLPWTGGKILAGEDCRFETIEDVPADEDADRAFFNLRRIKSALLLPLSIDEKQVGVGVFSTVHQQRSWSEKITIELRLLAEVLMNAYSKAETTQSLLQRERDLSRSEALANVGSYSFFPNLTTDEWPPTGRLALSKEMRKLLDYPTAEATFDDLNSRIHIDDRERVLNSMKALLDKGTVLQHEYRLVRPNGDIVHVEEHGEVDRRGDEPESVMFFGTLKDISERVLRENDLREALVEIEQLKKNLEEENLELRDEIKSVHGFDKIIGNSRSLRQCLDLVRKVAPTDATVLLLGETGVGKELIANAVHDQSARREGRMVSVNCAALPEALIESELFGHEKGAFTGAVSARKGRFELADGGTLFLDEIGEMPLSLQSKLLRAIQEGEFQRLGGSKTLKVDVRIIAATNRDLEKLAKEGGFRADLYYRIGNFPIEVPSLSERKDDIPLLAEHFVRKLAPELGKNIKAISTGMLSYLQDRSWSGNVRELEGFIQHALITSEGDVLTLGVRNGKPARKPVNRKGQNNDAKATLSSIEHDHIKSVLNQTDWLISGKKGAAKILGVPPSTLRSRMKKLGIEHPRKDAPNL